MPSTPRIFQRTSKSQLHGLCLHPLAHCWRLDGQKWFHAAEMECSCLHCGEVGNGEHRNLVHFEKLRIPSGFHLFPILNHETVFQTNGIVCVGPLRSLLPPLHCLLTIIHTGVQTLRFRDELRDMSTKEAPNGTKMTCTKRTCFFSVRVRATRALTRAL